jgi:hypothetical protein
MTSRIGIGARLRIVLFAIAVGCILLVPAGTAAAKKKVRIGVGQARVAKAGPPRAMYWGAWIGRGLTGTDAPYDMSAVSKFQNMVGKPLSLIEWSLPFQDCTVTPCQTFNFPSAQMTDVRQYGAIPFMSWGSSSLSQNPDVTQQPDFQLSDVISGRYDSLIRNWAIAARDWGHPFFLRFNWEQNGYWFPWGTGVNGNQAGEYVPAWKHVHDIFTSVGASNATWVWCPYVDPFTKQNIRALYPGDDYVDWTCLDGYNWGPQSPANPIPWRTFKLLYSATYKRVADQIAPNKPMIFAEMASSDYGGDKPGWISTMFRQLLKDYPVVRGLIWFDVNDRNAHWELEGNPGAISAFSSGISHPRYLPNGFGGISGSPIPPP